MSGGRHRRVTAERSGPLASGVWSIGLHLVGLSPPRGFRVTAPDKLSPRAPCDVELDADGSSPPQPGARRITGAILDEGVLESTSFANRFRSRMTCFCLNSQRWAMTLIKSSAVTG